MSNSTTQFKPGQSGNPKGRPKRDWTMAGLLEEALEEEDLTGVSYKRIIALKLRTLAVRGSIPAIKEISNRLDGMPKQPIEHAGDFDNPIRIDLPGVLAKVYGNTEANDKA